MAKTKTQDELTLKYAKKLEPLLELAKKAYGLRGQNTPAHRASAKYTELVKEYYSKGGSLVALASELGVAYSGLRRRVFSSAVSPTIRMPRSRATEEITQKALSAVIKAKDRSTEAYHAELHKAYHSGVSLAHIAKGLGLSSSAPLYYAIQRHEIRLQTKK